MRGFTAPNIGDDKELMEEARKISCMSTVLTVRFKPTISDLIKAESIAQKMTVSEFLRRAALSNMRYMRRQALDAWGQ
jgi:hypothetical protein